MDNLNMKSKGRINIKSVAGGFVAILIILIFLSASIFNHNLPSVTAAMPNRGHLNQVELTTGIVQYANTIELAADISGTIENVLVREGEHVRAGQPLIEMNFRGADDEIHQRIEDATANFNEQIDNIRVSRSRAQLDLERVASNIINTQRQIDELKNETDREETVSDFEIRQTQSEIQRAEHDLSVVKQLAEAGIATQQELRNAENHLAILNDRLNNQQQIFNEHVDRNNERLEDQAENRARQIRNFEHQLETLKKDQRARNLDLESLSIQEESTRRAHDRRIEDYQSRLNDFSENSLIMADIDGVIVHLPVSQGQHVSANQRLVALGQNLVIEAEIPLSNTFVTVGSEAVLHNSAHTLDGVVTVVNPHEHAKRLTIEFVDFLNSEYPADSNNTLPNISAGETFTIQFSARSSESFILVPNSAVNRDGDGYFLNQVRRRQGMLGTEFYTERLRVYIGESDTEHTAIIRGITFFEPIALASDRPFTERETIRLRNESDFFEN